MATKTDRTLTIRNFEELTKAVTEGSKTILTCRTHYFTDKRHVDEIFSNDQGNELLQSVNRRPNFQIIELQEFTDEQIQRLLSLYSPSESKRAWLVIRRNLHDIARRPFIVGHDNKNIANSSVKSESNQCCQPL